MLPRNPIPSGARLRILGLKLTESCTDFGIRDATMTSFADFREQKTRNRWQKTQEEFLNMEGKIDSGLTADVLET